MQVDKGGLGQESDYDVFRIERTYRRNSPRLLLLLDGTAVSFEVQ